MIRPLGLVACLMLVPVAAAGQTPPASEAGNGGAARLPWLSTVEGKPIDSRPPEKKDNAPTFPEQTRAPYRPTAPFKVTTLIDNLNVPWSLAFLPSGNIILTERLPGRMRILDKSGKLSDPLAGVSVGRVAGRERHRPARRRARPQLREEPANLLQLLRVHRQHRHQYVRRAGAARGVEVRGDRCRGHLPLDSGDAVETPGRQDRRTDCDWARWQPVHDHRRSV